MKGYPRVLRGPDRLGRRRRQSGVVGVRLAPDDGHGRGGHVREVRLLVRQRVGLLQPRQGPRQAHDGVGKRSQSSCGAPDVRGPVQASSRRKHVLEEDRQGRRRARQAGPRARRLQRADRRGRGHRRHARSRGAADAPLPRRPRRPGDHREPSRPAEGRAGPAVLAAPRSPRAAAPASAGTSSSSTTSSAPRRTRPSSAWSTARSSCSRTCASIPARRRTTPRSPRRSRRSRTSTSTTRSVPRIARTPRPRASREFLPAYAGLLLAREVETLTDMLADPERPFVAILGGSKVSRQVRRHRPAHRRASTCCIIGGGMAFTFLVAKGIDVGKSIVEPEWVEPAKEMLVKAAEQGRRPHAAGRLRGRRRVRRGRRDAIVGREEIPDDMMGLDIGPATTELFKRRHRRRQDDLLERPDGRLRDDAVRDRHARGRRGVSPATTARSRSSAAATRSRR